MSTDGHVDNMNTIISEIKRIKTDSEQNAFTSLRLPFFLRYFPEIIDMRTVIATVFTKMCI